MDPGQHPRIGTRRRMIALLALTVALARALIPIGFMPAAVHGTVQLMFCDGGGHHHGGGTAPGHDPAGHASDQGPCPFALSGGAALAPSAAPAPALAAIIDEVALAPATTALREVPPRYAAPRGPPTRA